MTGSRDPIREYLREVEHDRRQRILNWVLAFAAAIILWVIIGVFLVWAFTR